jgi:hypothetical protein
MSNHRRRWLPKTVELGSRISDVTTDIKSCGKDPFPHVDTEVAPEYRGCPPRLHLISAERGNPHEVWDNVDGVQPTASTSRSFRKADTTPQEDKMVQEAKVGSRKAQGKHILPNRATMRW